MRTLVDILTKDDVYLDASKWQHYTDKELHTVGGHKYCSTFYDAEFAKYYPLKNVKFLEIGILRGASLCLWNEYFNDPIIVGVDIINRLNENPEFYQKCDSFFDTRIAWGNAYTEEAAQTINDKFDIILDDGSHVYYDQCEFLKIYPKYLTDRGVLIIEDIQSPDFIEGFISLVDKENFTYRVIDTRDEVGIPDNLLFVFNRK